MEKMELSEALKANASVLELFTFTLVLKILLILDGEQQGALK